MDFVEQLKSSIDIVKVVGEYVRLKRIGATGRYFGLRPFHQEKTPSFNVNQGRQFFKCFGCGAGGDALKFVMDFEGMTFPEALKYLADHNGIPMPKRTEYADSDSKLRGALHDIHSIATKLYQSALASPQGSRSSRIFEQARPDAGVDSDLRARVFRSRRSGAGASFEQRIVYAGAARIVRSGAATHRRKRNLRYLSRPSDVSDSQRIRQGDRVRRTGARRR